MTLFHPHLKGPRSRLNPWSSSATTGVFWIDWNWQSSIFSNSEFTALSCLMVPSPVNFPLGLFSYACWIPMKITHSEYVLDLYLWARVPCCSKHSAVSNNVLVLQWAYKHNSLQPIVLYLSYVIIPVIVTSRRTKNVFFSLGHSGQQQRHTWESLGEIPPYFTSERWVPLKGE